MLKRETTGGACWRAPFTFLATTATALLAFAWSAYAIVYGVPDGDDHPNVGSIVLRVPDVGLIQWCSGTLIAENVFLTASHCTQPLDGLVARRPGTEVLVTFDSTISESGTFYTGTWYTNPNYGTAGREDLPTRTTLP
jgi:hypothetical protein